MDKWKEKYIGDNEGLLVGRHVLTCGLEVGSLSFETGVNI